MKKKKNAGTIEQYATASDGTPLHWIIQAPAGPGPWPWAILIHGGHFNAEDPGNPFSHCHQDLVSAGYFVASIEYRLAPPNPLPGQTSDGRFPQQTNDCELAVAAAKSDPRCNSQVFAIGGSAGGSHVMSLAGKKLVNAAVPISPATQLDDPISLEDRQLNFWFNNYAPGHLAEASPNNVLVSDEPPIFLIAFAQDHMPATQFTLAVSKLNSLGASYQSELVPGAGHAWNAWPTVKGRVILFLNALQHGSLSSTIGHTTDDSSETIVPTKIGAMYLTTSDKGDQQKSLDLLIASPCWTNPHVKGVVVRTDWDRIHPANHTRYWDFLEAGVNKAIESGKLVSLSIGAGVSTPDWFTELYPDDCFLITSANDGSQHLMALPWMPNFQAKWTLMVKKLAKRYDNRIVHIDMGGFGRKTESYFATEGDDFDRITALAQSQGYADAADAWLTGAKWVTDTYATYFKKAAFICVGGAPFTDANNGAAVLQELVDYGVATYPERFGFASHGLRPHGTDESIGMNLPPTIRRGFQFLTAQQGDTDAMKICLDKAIGAGAEWVEVYDTDCDDPAQAANLDAANAEMV